MIRNGTIKPVEIVQTQIDQISGLRGLSIPVHDFIALGYTGSDLTSVVYKTGGALGAVVATLALTYLLGQLLTVTKT